MFSSEYLHCLKFLTDLEQKIKSLKPKTSYKASFILVSEVIAAPNINSMQNMWVHA